MAQVKIASAFPAKDRMRVRLLFAIALLLAATHAAAVNTRTTRLARGALNNELRSLIGQGRLEEAEERARAAMQNSIIQLGETHPNTLNAKSSLAVVLWQRGKLDQSERLQRAALRSMEECLGRYHQDTRICRDNLVVAMRQRGRKAEAKKLAAENQNMRHFGKRK